VSLNGQAKIKHKLTVNVEKHYKNVKSVGGGTSVLKHYKIQNNREIHYVQKNCIVYILIQKTSEDKRIAMYQSLPLKWPCQQLWPLHQE
jgi:hypothetical protein